jgi:uncharacterized protein (TIGR02145 family)
LNTSIYANGDPIPNVTLSNQWSFLDSGAWTYYMNDPQYQSPFGKLYNWYSISDVRNVCPNGWHVPSKSEWETLIYFLDPFGLNGPNLAGEKMKSIGTQIWQFPNTDASNLSGFSGLPGGFRDGSGSFYNLSNTGVWWSSTEENSGYAWASFLYYNSEVATFFSSYKLYGLSVRCIRN